MSISTNGSNSYVSSENVARLPALRNNSEIRRCKICGAASPFFDVVDFNKICHPDLYPYALADISVSYYRCMNCEFIFTDFFDAWSPSDFKMYIYNHDYPLIDPEYNGSRPLRMAQMAAQILKGFETSRVLDYGSGAGMFTEALRALGFPNVTNYDPFSEPERPKGKFDIITCFEVIEHALSPTETFIDMLDLLTPEGSIIISSSLQPENIKEIRCNWWYIAPRNGHISIFSTSTFDLLAERFGLRLHLGNGDYGFSRAAPGSGHDTLLERIGPSDDVVDLGAPELDGHPCWNDYEISGRTVPFRWTSSSEIFWSPRYFRRTTTRIRIPFILEIDHGFASRSQIILGDKPLETEIISGSINAVATLRSGEVAVVRLVTPPPRSPRGWRTKDKRLLGLAVPIG